VAAIVITLIILMTIMSQSNSNEGNKADSNVGWSYGPKDVSQEAYNILYSGTDNAFMNALSFFDTKISEEIDLSKAFELRIARANFAVNNGGEQIALDGLLDIDESTLTDTQRYELYSQLLFAYRVIGNENASQEYSEKISKLPKEVTTVGE
jgi:hypothetical protein